MSPNLRSRRGAPPPGVPDTTSSTNFPNGTEKESPSAPTVQSKPSNRLVTFSELPTWLQDNPYIVASYRPPSYSILRSFHSLTYLHTESVNVYSHLIPALLVPFISYYLYTSIYLPAASSTTTTTKTILNKLTRTPPPSLSPSLYSTLTTSDLLVWTCFAFGTLFCLGVSALYHLVHNVSSPINKWGNQLDYAGIVALIWGSFVPTLFYGFYCNPPLLKLYIGMISALALTTTVTSLHPLFRTPKYRPMRAALFIALGLSSLFPIVHSLFLLPLPTIRKLMSLEHVVTQGALYIVGATIYANRVPERWAKERRWGLREGAFDVWGGSHQIFHVCVVLAVGVHGWGVWRAMVWRHGEGGKGCEI